MSTHSFDELEWQEHPADPSGKLARVFFENGYGASVIHLDGSHGHKQGLYELAVLKGDTDDWGLTYETPITDDVLGYLSPADVTKTLAQIAPLPSAEATR